MKHLKKLISIVAAITTLTIACTKEIDFDKDLIEPKLVANCIFTNGDSLKIDLTISQPYTNLHNSYPLLDGATVKLSQNGQLLGNANIVNSTINGLPLYYKVDAPLTTNNTYQLEVNHPNYETLSAETKIPNPVKIISTDTVSSVYDYGWGYTEIRTEVRLKFSDPAGERNFYRLKLNRLSGHSYDNYDNEELVVEVSKSSDEWIDSQDNLLNPQTADDFFLGSTYNRFNLFSDELIDGKEYTLKFFLSNNYYNKNSPGNFIRHEIQLYSVSEEYYLYLKSISDNYNGMEFLAEPVQIFNNIENGLGIFAGYSKDSSFVQRGEYPIDTIKYVYKDDYNYWY